MKPDWFQRTPDRRMFLKATTGSAIAAMVHGPSRAFAAPDRLPRTEASHRAETTTAAKVIIDTDPGVDDAFALMLAMRSPELNVLAITAVAGNLPLEITLPNALRMVEICDRTDIPVASGAAAPLIRRQVTASYAHGENGLGGVKLPPPKITAVKEHAAELICRIVLEHPGEVTLIGLGPLTNLALALRSEPGLAKAIKSIVLMGGSLSGGNVTPAAEFNFYVDPEAASIVFNSEVPITMVGLDVTRKVELTEPYILQLEAATNKPSRAAAGIARAIMASYRGHGEKGGPTLHDPLAVSALIRPDILTFESYRVQIETNGLITAGESVGWKRGPIRYAAAFENSPGATPSDETFTANTQVAVDVRPDAFFRLLVDRITGNTQNNG
ncbi:nucleoside hydrolase [Granulicella sp. S190]|uniref:nucleoside hydrolase n=1 Tax=Granulicella sp. S190 TaxID=1747226 RepID=UPI00131AC521|nr:nucleoside hydrolase [Granulicella sp. S190]